MKKLFLLLILCCMNLVAWADSYTDANGVTWEYGESSYWDAENQEYVKYVQVYGLTGNDSVVVVPNTLPLGGVEYPVLDVSGFSDRSDITSVTLPSALKFIGGYAFSSCYSLRDINIPEGVETIEGQAFWNTSLKELSLPASVKSVGEYAFQYCHSLTITLPASLQNIGYRAFEGCKTVYLQSTDPTSINGLISADPFCDVQHIVVPDVAYNDYLSSTTWSGYASKICFASEVIEYKYTDANNVTWTYYYVHSTRSVRITQATGYTTNLVFPATLPCDNGNFPVKAVQFTLNYNANLHTVDLSKTQIMRIGNGDLYFFDCDQLQEVALPATLTTIGNSAFYGCDYLRKVEIPNGVVTIGNSAFYGCYSLREVEIPNGVVTIENSAFYGCSSLSEVEIPNGVVTIGNSAFNGCSSLREVEIPNSVVTIGNSAFNGCSSLREVEIPASVDSIGNYAFNSGSEKVFRLASTKVPTRESSSFDSNDLFVVPTAALNAYQTANVWSNYAANILPANMATLTVNVTAQSKGSGVLNAIGGSVNQTKIVDLTVKGTINGYDFVMFKDKMVNLRHLDLSEADIVYNPYCYYEGNYSQNDTLGAYAFHEEDKLISIKLPQSVKHIGHYAFGHCRSLKDIDFGENLQSIGTYAFYNCDRLTELTFPNSLKSIEHDAFGGCDNLQKVLLPNKIESVGSSAFWGCGSLKEVNFPTSLKRIENGAFAYTALEVVRIPSTLRSIGDEAFKSCGNLKKVYTYTLEPTSINENTFSNFETAMLYVPTASGQNYYWDEGWKRFVNVAEFDDIFTYFYINKDLILDASTGSVDGKPDAELFSGSGLIVEGVINLILNNLKIYHDGKHGASIIAKNEQGNVTAENMDIHINVTPGRWYFFSFPFDLYMRDISLEKKESQYVFRYYDGEERAKKGYGGWKDVEKTDLVYLKAGNGYIFQCSHDDVLTISLKDVTFKRENKQNGLTEHVAQNMQDASWNFTGNPYLSYYDIKSLGYDAPITIWNGYAYEAINPMDDDYAFAPFEAFFVQKPQGVANIGFYGEAQITGREAGANNAGMGTAQALRGEATDAVRKLVNITLSDGALTDRTRIVFNEKADAAYETACDAAKFSTAGVPQLYTIDSRAVKYAINERPVGEGVVTLGYTVPAQGNYVMEAPRMDVEVLLKDNATGTVHNFSEGAYEFASEAGTFEGRFTIVMSNREATSIDSEVLMGDDAPVYNVKGQRVDDAREQGVYIKNNRKVVNL